MDRPLLGKLLPLWIILAAFAIAAVMVQLKPEPPRREPPPSAPFVTTAPAEALEGAIPIDGAGTVEPSAQVEVVPRVGGKVAWVAAAYQSGGGVKAGDVLFRIEDADYRHRVQRARASVARQRVALLQSEQEARLARAEYGGIVLRHAAGTDSGAPNPLALRDPQLQAARAGLERDSAVLADAELALRRTEVRAPFDGVVRSETVAVGQLVGGGRSVGSIYAIDAVEIEVPLTDDDAALIPGLWRLADGGASPRVRAVVSAEYGGAVYRWDAHVDRAVGALDPRTRTIRVVVLVPEPMTAGYPASPRAEANESSAAVGGGAPPLLVGQFAEVEIDGAAPGPYFRIPRAALRPGGEVWALADDGRLAIVPVRVLRRSDESAYVMGDLADGQPTVVAGLREAAEGMEVRAGPL